MKTMVCESNSTLRKKAGRPAAFTQDQALEEAVLAFWKNGYEGTDLEKIAASLGATKPSLYRLFGCKKTLFLEALVYYSNKSFEAITKPLTQELPIKDALMGLVAETFANTTREGEPHGCFLACVAVAESQNHPEAGFIFRESLLLLEERVELRLLRAMEEGELPREFPSARRAKHFINHLLASSLRARVGETQEELMDTARDIVSSTLCVLISR